MDCLSPSHPCEMVVVMAGRQMLKTELILNFLGYIVDQDPGPVLIVEPREEDAKALSKDRVAPMFRDTPILRDKLSPARSRDTDNTTLHKAIDVTTPILTPNGWSLMLDLQAGDVVYDENGAQCNVTAVSPVFWDRPCYRVTFSDGCALVADGEHAWWVKRCEAIGEKQTIVDQVLTTEQIKESVANGGLHTFSIPLAKPLQDRAAKVSRQIVAVEPVNSVPVKCITVDSPNRLYLAGHDLIPTHNSFDGGHVTFVGAISPSGLAMRPIRYVCLDEVDRYPKSAGSEGDPCNLAIGRTDEFAWNKKILICSTPTIEGNSRIADAYEGSTQNKPYVPCPFCGRMQILEWGNLKFEHGPDSAAYECIECRQRIQHHKKAWMLEHGEWREHNRESKIPGFWINQLYSSRKSWSSLAAEFIRASKSPEQLKTFVNTVLGETWKERGEAPEYKRIYERREDWKAGTVPMGGVFLTAGVDVQADRIEIHVKAWGREKENWTIDYAVLDESRTTEAAVWNQLTRFLNRTYRHESGVDLHIARVAIDSGAVTQEVYSWARLQGPGRLIVVKGYGSGAAILGSPTAVDVTSRGKKARRGVKVWPLNVSMIKEELYGWLRLERPSDEQLKAGVPYPPGYCHFPKFYDEEWFKQLTAEELVTRIVKGYKVSEWQKTRPRNEVLDTHNYARAAASHIGLDRFQQRDWLALESHFAKAKDPDTPMDVPQARAPEPVQASRPTQQAPPRQLQQAGADPYAPRKSNWLKR
jgi:phage terminase large subunit GpA-like protein